MNLANDFINPGMEWRGMKSDVWEGGHRVPLALWDIPRE
jgi:hypothetical protein